MCLRILIVSTVLSHLHLQAIQKESIRQIRLLEQRQLFAGELRELFAGERGRQQATRGMGAAEREILGVASM